MALWTHLTCTRTCTLRPSVDAAAFVPARSVGRIAPRRHHQHQQDFFPHAIGAERVLAAYPLPLSLYYIICPHCHVPALKRGECSTCGTRLEASSTHPRCLHSLQLPVIQASNLPPKKTTPTTHSPSKNHTVYASTRCSSPTWREWSNSKSIARLVAPRQTVPSPAN
jgi:hypothetical protein